MIESELYAVAYNAHERAESAAYEAMLACLRAQSIDALACLADPSWQWETRGSISRIIIACASEVLDEKLEAQLDL